MAGGLLSGYTSNQCKRTLLSMVHGGGVKMELGTEMKRLAAIRYCPAGNMSSVCLRQSLIPSRTQFYFKGKKKYLSK